MPTPNRNTGATCKGPGDICKNMFRRTPPTSCKLKILLNSAYGQFQVSHGSSSRGKTFRSSAISQNSSNHEPLFVSEAFFRLFVWNFFSAKLSFLDFRPVLHPNRLQRSAHAIEIRKFLCDWNWKAAVYKMFRRKKYLLFVLTGSSWPWTLDGLNN